MKCSQKYCVNDITNEPIVIMVGDVSKGNFWGNYCSYDCLIMEASPALIHLRDGKSLASYVTPKTMGEYVALVNATYGGVAANQTVAGANNAATVIHAAIPTPDSDPVVAPAPMQADHNAWGDVPGFGTVEGAATAVVDPVVEGINAVAIYTQTLTTQLNGLLANFASGVVPTNKLFENGAQYNISETHYAFPMDGYEFKVVCTAKQADDKVVLVMQIANTPAYGLTINVQDAPVSELANACIKHFKTIATPLKEAANAQNGILTGLTAGAATPDPF